MTKRRGGPAHSLVGRELDGGWVVERKMEPSDNHTGGAFSVGYIVRDKAGRTGFLKAFDYISAFDQSDPAPELERMTTSYNAERKLLELCGKAGMDRVVRALDAGAVRVGDTPLSTVNYIILEAADDDARRVIADRTNMSDHSAGLGVAHDTAVGVAQLHGRGVAHQDIKPSNVLLWRTRNEHSAKIGDLGCAHLAGRPAPHDEDTLPGDPAYAAPEQLYCCTRRLAEPRWREAADVYMLGNLVTFLLTGLTFNGLLYQRLDPSQHWKRWTGSFDSVLPGLVDAYGETIALIQNCMNVKLADSITLILQELCHPDVFERGDRLARHRRQNPFNLGRFVTRLDLVYRRARIAC